ncbi:MAG: toxin [Amycolatopsis sp.]|uniref:DUF397 domain-containing protein n=1 Tax=Amycolatopsis sp. TaxID=37632 RepID=UPI0026386395|nr:DUF397 domain-containing protein [Amycolatopsis sp.]MCU1687210.1 toxin [Amycolatopsis sp.]
MDLTNAHWRKSSYSGGSGENGDCVEVAFVPNWRKSTYSGGEGSNGDCVEVALTDSVVAIRDSKSPAAGALTLPAPSWRAYLSTLTA